MGLAVIWDQLFLSFYAVIRRSRCPARCPFDAILLGSGSRQHFHLDQLSYSAGICSSTLVQFKYISLFPIRSIPLTPLGSVPLIPPWDLLLSHHRDQPHPLFFQWDLSGCSLLRPLLLRTCGCLCCQGLCKSRQGSSCRLEAPARFAALREPFPSLLLKLPFALNPGCTLCAPVAGKVVRGWIGPRV